MKFHDYHYATDHAYVLTAVGFKSQAADESTFDDVVPLRRCIRAIVGIHISDAPVMA